MAFSSPDSAGHISSHFYETDQAFLNGYAWLAHFCVQQQLCVFGVKTKAHFQKHALLEIYFCSQNEDLIGLICKLGRTVDGRFIAEKVLEVYLIKAAVLLRRHERVHKDLDAK